MKKELTPEQREAKRARDRKYAAKKRAAKKVAAKTVKPEVKKPEAKKAITKAEARENLTKKIAADSHITPKKKAKKVKIAVDRKDNLSAEERLLNEIFGEPIMMSALVSETVRSLDGVENVVEKFNEKVAACVEKTLIAAAEVYRTLYPTTHHIIIDGEGVGVITNAMHEAKMNAKKPCAGCKCKKAKKAKKPVKKTAKK